MAALARLAARTARSWAAGPKTAAAAAVPPPGAPAALSPSRPLARALWTPAAARVRPTVQRPTAATAVTVPHRTAFRRRAGYEYFERRRCPRRPGAVPPSPPHQPAWY